MKKEKIELDIDAYLKSMRKNKKPSLSAVILSAVLMLWSFIASVTVFVVLCKLIVEAWKWIL